MSIERAPGETREDTARRMCFAICKAGGYLDMEMGVTTTCDNADQCSGWRALLHEVSENELERLERLSRVSAEAEVAHATALTETRCLRAAATKALREFRAAGGVVRLRELQLLASKQ